MLCCMAFISPVFAQTGHMPKSFSLPKPSAKLNAAATSKVTVEPWTAVDFGRVAVGRTQPMQVVLITEKYLDSGSGFQLPKFPSFSWGADQGQTEAPEPYVRMFVVGAAAADYVVQDNPEWQRGSSAGMGLVNYHLVATVLFQPSKEGVRKTALQINFRDYGSSGRQLIGMGAPAQKGGAVRMPRFGAGQGAMVSLVGNPTTLGVSVLDLGTPKKVKMSPEPLSPNAAWETVFPIQGSPNQTISLQDAVKGGTISGANAADFTLSAQIALKQGAPATRLITFSPRGSGLRTAEYTQLQFDGSTVTKVLEGYGK